MIEDSKEIQRLKKEKDQKEAQMAINKPILNKWRDANTALENAARTVIAAHSPFYSAMQAAASKSWHVHVKLLEILNDYVQPRVSVPFQLATDIEWLILTLLGRHLHHNGRYCVEILLLNVGIPELYAEGGG